MARLPTITERSPQPPWQDVNEAIDEFHASTNKQRRIEIIQQCVEWWTPMAVDWGQDWRYSRARQIVDGITPGNVRELIWPPNEFVGQGRRNATGITNCGDIRWGEPEDEVRSNVLLSPFTPSSTFPLR